MGFWLHSSLSDIRTSFRRDSEDHIHEGEDDGKYECDPESTDFESRDNPRYEENHEDIDDERKEPKGDDIEWEGEKLEYRNDDSIDYSEHDSDDDSSQISIDMRSWDEIRCYGDSYTREEEIEKYGHREIVNKAKLHTTFSSWEYKEKSKTKSSLRLQSMFYYFSSKSTIYSTLYLSRYMRFLSPNSPSV